MSKGHTGGDDYDIILCDVSLFLRAFDCVIEQIEHVMTFFHDDWCHTPGEIQLSCYPGACRAGDNV